MKELYAHLTSQESVRDSIQKSEMNQGIVIKQVVLKKDSDTTTWSYSRLLPDISGAEVGETVENISLEEMITVLCVEKDTYILVLEKDWNILVPFLEKSVEPLFRIVTMPN